LSTRAPPEYRPYPDSRRHKQDGLQLIARQLSYHNPAVDRGAIAQLIGSPVLAQKPQTCPPGEPSFLYKRIQPRQLHSASTFNCRIQVYRARRFAYLVEKSLEIDANRVTIQSWGASCSAKDMGIPSSRAKRGDLAHQQTVALPRLPRRKAPRNDSFMQVAPPSLNGYANRGPGLFVTSAFTLLVP